MISKPSSLSQSELSRSELCRSLSKMKAERGGGDKNTWEG